MLQKPANKRSSFLSTLDHWMTGITRILNIIGMVVLVAMAALTVLDVLMRNLFNSPILGGTELTEFMMIAMSFGMGWTLLKEKVIRMGLIVDRLSPTKQAIISSATYTLGTFTLAVITWSTWREVFVIHDMNAISSVLRIPIYPFYALLAFSYTVITISALTFVIQNIAKASKR